MVPQTHPRPYWKSWLSRKISSCNKCPSLDCKILQWLLTAFRIKSGLLRVAFKILCGLAPAYLSSIIICLPPYYSRSSKARWSLLFLYLCSSCIPHQKYPIQSVYFLQLCKLGESFLNFWGQDQELFHRKFCTSTLQELNLLLPLQCLYSTLYRIQS